MTTTDLNRMLLSSIANINSYHHEQPLRQILPTTSLSTILMNTANDKFDEHCLQRLSKNIYLLYN